MKIPLYSQVLSSLLLAATVPLSAQLSITQTNTEYTVDFESTVAGMNNGTFTAEERAESPAVTGGVDSRGIVFGNDTGWGSNMGGAPFRRGALGSLDSSDSRDLGWYSDNSIRRGSSASTAMVMHPGAQGVPRSTAVSFLFKNDTGSTLTQFDVDFVIDVWWTETFFNPLVEFSWQVISDPASLDSSNWGGNLANVNTSMNLDTEGYITGEWNIQDRSTTINTTLEEGDYLVIRYYIEDMDQKGGLRSPYIALDEISITAIPEPSTVAAFAGLLTLLVAFWFRGKAK